MLPSSTRGSIPRPELLRVQLDDEVLVDIRQDVVPRRHLLEHARISLSLTSTQSGRPTWAAISARSDAQLLARLLAHLHHVAGLHLVRRDRHASPLTSTPLWLTSWRASARVAAKPMR
jgi:hypothetical protein